MKPRVSLLAIASAVALATSARADDLQSLLEEQVVVSASKSAETTTSTPGTSTLITAEELSRYGIRSLDEALNFLAMGIVVENTQHDDEIGARGVHFIEDFGDHVLLLVNGHALNEQWGGTAYFERGTAIPFELIDHIEVILGPGSVLYGSNAVLAVINVVTKRAKDWDGVHAAVEAEIPTSIRTAAGFGRTFRLFGQEGEVTTELEYFAQSGPDFRLGPQFVKDTRFVVGGPRDGVWGGLANQANYASLPSGYLRVFLGHLEINARAAYWKRQSPFDADAFDDPNSYEIDRFASLDVKHTAVLSPSVDLVSRLYGDSYDYRQNYVAADGGACPDGMPQGCLYKLVGVARWVGLEEQLSVDWLKDGAFVSLLGVDGRLRDVGSKTDYVELVTGRTPGSLDTYDLVEKALGAYAQQVIRPWKRLALNGGLRLDVDDRFGAHASPRVAAAFEPWDGGTLKALYSEAFRAPSAFERYYADPGDQIAAPKLKPETVQSIEGSFDQRAHGQHALFGIFHTVYQSLVASEFLSPAALAAAKADGQLDQNIKSATQNRNVASVEATGFDAGLDGAALAGRLRYGATFTAAYARQRESTNGPPSPLPVAPQASGNARISFDLGGMLPTLALAARFVGPRPVDDDSGGKPLPDAPLLVELRATVSGKAPFVKGLSYRVSVDGVSTDKEPYTIGPDVLRNGNGELLPLDRFRTAVGLNYDSPL